MVWICNDKHRVLLVFIKSWFYDPGGILVPPQAPNDIKSFFPCKWTSHYRVVCTFAWRRQSSLPLVLPEGLSLFHTCKQTCGKEKSDIVAHIPIIHLALSMWLETYGKVHIIGKWSTGIHTYVCVGLAVWQCSIFHELHSAGKALLDIPPLREIPWASTEQRAFFILATWNALAQKVITNSLLYGEVGAFNWSQWVLLLWCANFRIVFFVFALQHVVWSCFDLVTVF